MTFLIFAKNHPNRIWTFREHAILLQHNPHSAGLTFFKTANGFQVRFFPSPKVCQSSTVGFQHTFRAALERYEGVKLVSSFLAVAKPRPESFALWQLKRIRDPDFVTKDDQRGPAKKACNVFKTLECVSMYYKNMYIIYIYIYIYIRMIYKIYVYI